MLACMCLTPCYLVVGKFWGKRVLTERWCLWAGVPTFLGEVYSYSGKGVDGFRYSGKVA
jgi:hypothetical protein